MLIANILQWYEKKLCRWTIRMDIVIVERGQWAKIQLFSTRLCDLLIYRVWQKETASRKRKLFFLHLWWNFSIQLLDLKQKHSRTSWCDCQSAVDLYQKHYVCNRKPVLHKNLSTKNQHRVIYASTIISDDYRTI